MAFSTAGIPKSGFPKGTCAISAQMKNYRSQHLHILFSFWQRLSSYNRGIKLHLDRATIRALDGQVGQYIAPSGVGGNLRRFGIQSSKITELGWYEETSVDGLTVICTPSQHNSSRTILDWNRTLWGSYVLKDGAHTVFDSGDGGFGNHFSEIRERYGAPDLAIMECGQYGEKWHTTHMFPEESVQACRMLEAKLAVPVHWGAYVLSNHPWDDPPRRFRQRAEELNQRFRIPVLNQVIPVP